MSDSALKNLQLQAGGVFGEDQAGAEIPMHFGNPHAEYAVAAGEAAVIDLGTRTQLVLTGGDRAKFLHNFCTNDIRGLQPGEGREAFVTNVQGKVLAHILVFAEGDALWIDAVAANQESLATHLDRYHITEELTITDRTSDFTSILVTGPDSDDRLKRWGFSQEIPLLGHDAGDIAGASVLRRRVPFTNAPSYQLLVPQSAAALVWESLVEGGIRPCGTGIFHALRIEAGFPWYGLDITDANLAQEVARTTQAISFTKGCYLGQEPIARIDALGHVNQELRLLKLMTDPVPQPGTTITPVTEPHAIGRITSSATSPQNDLPVALAYLKRNYLLPGTKVHVQTEGESIPAEVLTLDS